MGTLLISHMYYSRDNSLEIQQIQAILSKMSNHESLRKFISSVHRRGFSSLNTLREISDLFPHHYRLLSYLP